ncbi:MAG: hypothetical protein ACI8ZM_002164 [Crocinitomix sp.]|jgi:hypothetical protein
MRYTAILISALLLFSCGSSPEKSPLVADVINEVVEDSIIIEIDTVRIEQKILSQFGEEYSYFDDSLNIEVSGIHYHVALLHKFNFNGDEWLDYFVVEDHGGGPTSGYFYDGSTGDLIAGRTDEDFISSGAARDIEVKIIDVNCEDDQQELVVITGGGGSIGLYYFCNIYRYDNESNTARNIFSETISAVNWDEEESKDVNYIDVFYNDSACVNEITVQKGAEYPSDDFDPTAIKPFKESQVYHYVYDEYENQFLLDRVNCLGKNIDNETVNQLAKLNDWDTWDNDPDELLDLVDIVGINLEEQMKTGLLTITDDTEYINYTASDDGRVNMVTYTFPSGGTAGTIYHPILQFEKADGSYETKTFYPIESEDEYLSWEVNFYDIQRLPYYEKNLYVLIGTRKGSSSHFSAVAMVIELKDDTLILDYPAFSDAYSVLVFADDIGDDDQFCIACMDYDATKNAIIIEEVGKSDHLFMMENTIDPKEREVDQKGIVVWEFKDGKFELQR